MAVRIAIYCKNLDIPSFEQGIRMFSENKDIHIYTEFYEKSEDFIEKLENDNMWDFLAVAVPGARGMETVISTREIFPETPLLWCSDDAEFAVASYRLRCNMFLPMPLKQGDLEEALERCLYNKIA